MNPNKLLLLSFFFPLLASAQSKKEQIAHLNFKVDSIHDILTKTIRKDAETIVRLEREILKLSKQWNDLKYERDSLAHILDIHREADKQYVYDTLNHRVTHKCYYYESWYPHLVSSPLPDSTRMYINGLIKELAFTIPAIMQNEDYKLFRQCEEGDYDHTKAVHEQHVTHDGCDWCQSEFSSKISHIEQGNTTSILMEVHYQAGGNWGHKGYNSLMMNGNKQIKIPSNASVKAQLMNEIRMYLDKTPLIDTDGLEYPIYDEINMHSIDDLTFYFKNNKLRIIYVNGAHGVWNQDFDIPLPRLQDHLKL